MTRTKYILALILTCQFWAAVSFADIKFYIEVNPASGSVNDEFTMSVVLQGTSSSVSPFLVGGEDFKLTLIGPERSVSIVNGVVDQRLAYSYRLIPKKSGELKTPGAEVEIDGKKYTADAQTVSVSGAASPIAPAPASKDSFLSQRVDKRDVYLGQQIVNTIDLYNSVQLFEPQFVDMLFDGFWNEALGEDRRSTRMMEGREFEVYSITKALFPLKTGTLTLPVRTLNAKIRERSQRGNRNPFGGTFDPFDQDAFDQFFNRGRVRDIAIESNSVEVNVQALPPAPANLPTWNLLSPIVGQTWVKATYSQGPIKTGESKTIEVDISSYGNLNPIKDVPLKAGNDFRIYQESPVSKNSVQGGRLLSRRIKKISVVALNPGKFEIPGIELSYFDPDSKQYQIAKSDPITIEVTGQPLSAKEPQTKAELQPQQNTQQEIEPPSQPQITTTPGLTWREETLLERLSAQISLGLAVLILGLLALTIWTLTLILRHLRAIDVERKVVDQIDGAGDLAKLATTFKESLSKDLGLKAASTSEQIKASVREKVSDPQLSSTILSTLDELEILLYSGQTNGTRKLSELKERIKTLSQQI